MNMKKTIGAVIACMLATLPVAAQRVCLWKNGICFDKIAVASVDSMTIDNNTSPNHSEELKQSDLVGTWRIIHQRQYAKGINATIEKDMECSFDCWVFTADNQIAYMEHSSDEFLWHEDGLANYEVKNGQLQIHSSSPGAYAKIRSFNGDVMTLEYQWGGDSDHDGITIVDSLKRYSKRTDVLRTNADQAPQRPETLPYLKSADLTGTWLITNMKRVRSNGNDDEDEFESGYVAQEMNYFVFFPSNKWGFIEYDGGNAWHLDGHEYIPFLIDNGVFISHSEEEYGEEDLVIIEKEGDVMKLRMRSTEDKGNCIVEKTYIYTVKRVSTATDYIKYEE